MKIPRALNFRGNASCPVFECHLFKDGVLPRLSAWNDVIEHSARYLQNHRSLNSTFNKR